MNSKVCLCFVKEFVESNTVSRAKSLELRNIKLCEQVSELEKIIKVERNNFENQRKRFQNDISKLTSKLAELSSKAMNSMVKVDQKFDTSEEC